MDTAFVSTHDGEMKAIDVAGFAAPRKIAKRSYH
jgi:hypothetical protein